VVEDVDDQQRVHDTEGGGDRDQDPDDPHFAAVRTEGADHALDRGTIDRPVRLLGGRGIEARVTTHALEDTTDPDKAVVGGQPIAMRSTSSTISGVNFPVKVFCWLGWKHPSSR